MEGRLGADLADVRVHADAVAARAAESVSARAFTAGSHIAFQRGQYDPASADGRLTLAHELTHVLQQRSGPVQGAAAGDGIRVSHPADSFERAAQASALRAMAAGRHAAALAPGAAGVGGTGLPVTPAGEVPVQRAVGYEFELPPGSSKVWTLGTTASGNPSKRVKTDSKEPLQFLDNHGGLAGDYPGSPYGGRAYISSDNGNVEYVTGPLETRRDVQTVVGSVAAFHASSSGVTSGNRTIQDRDGNAYQVYIDPAVPGARPQATIGITMQQVMALFAKLGQWRKEAGSEQPQQLGKTRSAQVPRTQQANRAQADAKRRVVMETEVNTGQAASSAEDVMRALGEPPYVIRLEERKKVLGFLAVIFKTTLDAGQVSATWQDPKYFFSMMARTDFISMFYSLNAVTREWLRDNLIEALRKTQGADWLDGNVMPRYRGADDDWHYGPARRAWLESILNGREAIGLVGGGTVPGKDLLSPPEGYPAHASVARPEGMGAMERDRGLSLFELRGLWNNMSPLPVDSWVTLAEVIFDLVEQSSQAAAAEKRDVLNRTSFLGDWVELAYWVMSRGIYEME